MAVHTALVFGDVLGLIHALLRLRLRGTGVASGGRLTIRTPPALKIFGVHKFYSIIVSVRRKEINQSKAQNKKVFFFEKEAKNFCSFSSGFEAAFVL